MRRLFRIGRTSPHEDAYRRMARDAGATVDEMRAAMQARQAEVDDLWGEFDPGRVITKHTAGAIGDGSHMALWFKTAGGEEIKLLLPMTLAQGFCYDVECAGQTAIDRQFAANGLKRNW